MKLVVHKMKERVEVFVAPLDHHDPNDDDGDDSGDEVDVFVFQPMMILTIM